jgi:hypothetical protein
LSSSSFFGIVLGIALSHSSFFWSKEKRIICHDGSNQSHPRRSAITIELEKACMKALGKCIEQSLPQAQGHYERTSFESYKRICTIQLLSPPNQIG